MERSCRGPHCAPLLRAMGWRCPRAATGGSSIGRLRAQRFSIEELSMKKLTRRRSLTLLAFSPLAAWGSENQPAATPAPQHAWAKIAPREMIRQRYFPDVVLRTQENKEVQLY